MAKFRNPHNALDELKDAVDDQLGQYGITMESTQSEYCDQTFIVMVRMENTEIEINLLFYPESYSMTARFPDTTSDDTADRFIQVFREKLDQCVYY